MRFKPDIRLELGSNEAIKESVAGGLGIGVVSRNALHGLHKEHGVSVIELDGFPPPLTKGYQPALTSLICMTGCESV